MNNLRETVVYISGPYRAPTEDGVHENIERARAFAKAYWQCGYTAFCPHTNTAYMGGSCPDSAWLEGDLVMLRRCDMVALMPGWKQSEGSRAEEALAHELGKTIIYPDGEI